MTTDVLKEHQHIWEQKPVLRAIYHDYYERLLPYIKPGDTLEVGGGTGNLKHYLKDVVSTDILQTPWLDTTCDAQFLPFKNNSFDNMVGMDILHHIESPLRFFKEVKRVLKKGGRVVLLEPAITKASWFFYHFLHPEPVILDANPLVDAPLSKNRQAFDANQAIPELLFGKFNEAFHTQFPALKVITKQYLSLFAYPLSGGFRKWSFIPTCFVNPLLKLEKHVEKIAGKQIGFRLLIVIEKKD